MITNIDLRGPACCTNGIRGMGDPTHGVFLVGISPGAAETRTGVPMSGPSGKLIDAMLEACGWHRSKCYATNVVCYQTQRTTFDQIMQCRPRLNQEIEMYKPKLCVLMGKAVYEPFFPSKRTNLRGVVEYYAPWNCYILPTHHPAALLHENSGEALIRDIIRDFQKIAPFFSQPPRPDVCFKIVKSVAEAKAIFDKIPTDRKIALDVETPMKEEDGTSSVDDPIVCFSISDGEHTYWFDADVVPIKVLDWQRSVDRGVEWGGHNFMYDSVSVHKHTGVMLPIAWDSMYLSYCREERGGVHGLKPNAREYESAGPYDDYDDKKLPKRPAHVPPKSKDARAYAAWKWNCKLQDKEWASQYNSKDGAYSVRVADRFEPLVVADQMWPVYQEMLDAARVYRQMQQHGVYINPERVKKMTMELVPLCIEKERALREHVFMTGGPENINLGSPDQLAEYLYTILQLPVGRTSAKTGKPSTDAEVLEALEDDSDFVARLLDLRHLEKSINTFLLGSWRARYSDGRVHPTPLLHRTVSGRLAYEGPAINTMPKTYNENPYLQGLRQLFTACDDDHVLIEMDYKQAEVWMAWQYSQDPQMLADLQGGDFHRTSAAFIFRVPYSDPRELKKLITEEQRSDSKRITFGKMFLIGPDKFARQSNREKRRDALRTGKPFDNPMTKLEAAEYSRAWDARYPGYMAYVRDAFREARDTGELVSIDGRKRRFPLVLDDKIINQVANWKIQTTAHACLMKSIVDMFPVLTSKYDAWPLIDVHDAVLIEAPKRVAMDVAKEAAAIMMSPRYPGLVGLQAEVKMGYSWGEMHEIEVAA